MFNNQDVEVVVNVTETPDGMYVDFDTNLMSPVVDDATSMSYGGTLPNIFDWNTDASNTGFDKFITLNAETLGATYNYIATHEFGHTLGLGDAYKSNNPGGINDAPGVDYNKYQDVIDTIMDTSVPKILTPTDNDIEMLILAWWTGKQQNFQIQPDIMNTISDALGKGN